MSLRNKLKKRSGRRRSGMKRVQTLIRRASPSEPEAMNRTMDERLRQTIEGCLAQRNPSPDTVLSTVGAINAQAKEDKSLLSVPPKEMELLNQFLLVAVIPVYRSHYSNETIREAVESLFMLLLRTPAFVDTDAVVQFFYPPINQTFRDNYQREYHENQKSIANVVQCLVSVVEKFSKNVVFEIRRGLPEIMHWLKAVIANTDRMDVMKRAIFVASEFCISPRPPIRQETIYYYYIDTFATLLNGSNSVLIFRSSLKGLFYLTISSEEDEEVKYLVLKHWRSMERLFERVLGWWADISAGTPSPDNQRQIAIFYKIVSNIAAGREVLVNQVMSLRAGRTSLIDLTHDVIKVGPDPLAREACFLVSNLVVESEANIRRLIDAGIIGSVSQLLLGTSGTRSHATKIEAAHALLNALNSSGSSLLYSILHESAGYEALKAMLAKHTEWDEALLFKMLTVVYNIHIVLTIAQAPELPDYSQELWAIEQEGCTERVREITGKILEISSARVEGLSSDGYD